MKATTRASRLMGHVWEKHLGQALKSPYLVMLFLGSVLLSIVSFFTTFAGMLDFMPVWIFSAFITFAVQALLFVTSWRLGFMVAGKEPIAWLDTGVFVVCFCTSVFFSFSSLFNYIYNPELQAATTRTRIHNTVEETITELELQAKERRQQLVQELTGTNAYAEWRDNVLLVAQAAAGAKDRLQGIFAERYRRLQKQVSAAEKAVASTAARKGTIAQDIAEGQNALERREVKIPLLEQAIAKLGQQLSDADQLVIQKQAEMDAEEKGGGQDASRPRGRGPVWRKLSKEKDVLAANRNGIKEQLEHQRAQLDALLDQRSKLRRKLDEDKALQATIDTEIAASAERARLARQQLDSSGSTENFNPSESANTLRGFLDEFSRDYELKPFDQAANLCTTLLLEMKKIPELASSIQKLTCDRGAMSAMMNPINDAATALGRLQSECVSGGEKANVVTDLPTADALAYARTCMNISGLPNAVIRPLRDEVDRVDREESDKASPFTKVTNALLSREKLAMFSLAIALVIDLLVLFSGLIGARSVRSMLGDYVNKTGQVGGDVAIDKAMDLDYEIYQSDTVAVRRYKMILSNANPESLDLNGVHYSSRVDLGDLPDHRAQMEVKNALAAFEGAGQGYVARDRNDPGVYYLRSGVLDYLRHRLIDVMEMDEVLGRSQGEPRDPGLGTVPGPTGEGARAATGFKTLSPESDELLRSRATAFGDALDRRRPRSQVPKHSEPAAARETVDSMELEEAPRRPDMKAEPPPAPPQPEPPAEPPPAAQGGDYLDEFWKGWREVQKDADKGGGPGGQISGRS